MSSIKILHTADWQIGKPFMMVKDNEKRFKLQNERISTVSRIFTLAEQNNVDLILVAGDLFDSSTVAVGTIMEILEIFGSANIPIVVLPGNHDHAGAGGVWRRQDLVSEWKRRAPQMKLLDKKAPVILDNSVILPCPFIAVNTLSNLDLSTYCLTLS